MTRFVEEYLVDLNGAQAAIRAGYSQKTAKEQAYRLLNHPGVQEAIAAGKSKLAAKSDVTAEEVVRGLARIARADLRDYLTWGPEGVTLKHSTDLTGDQAAAVAEVSEHTTAAGTKTVKFKLRDSKGAMDSLARHFGLFNDKVEHGVSDEMAELLALVNASGRPKPPGQG